MVAPRAATGMGASVGGGGLGAAALCAAWRAGRALCRPWGAPGKRVGGRAGRACASVSSARRAQREAGTAPPRLSPQVAASPRASAAQLASLPCQGEGRCECPIRGENGTWRRGSPPKKGAGRRFLTGAMGRPSRPCFPGGKLEIRPSCHRASVCNGGLVLGVLRAHPASSPPALGVGATML